MAKKRKPEIRVAFFDIDGTLYRDNFSLRITEILLEMGVVQPVHYEDLEVVLGRWRERRATYDALTAELTRTIRYGLEGVMLDDLLTAGHRAAQEGVNRPYLFTRALLDVLKSMNPKPYLVAISGSPTAVIQPYCHALGFNEVHATMFELDDGRITGGFDRATSPYHTKNETCLDVALRLDLPIERELITGAIAIGDALADHKMFDVVEYPIAFNPTAQLHAVCRQESTPVVTERKDVIGIQLARWGKSTEPMIEVTIEEILPTKMATKMRKYLPGLYTRG